MEFLPMPQKVVHGEGHFAVRFYSKIVLLNTRPEAFLYAQMLKKDFEKYAGLSLDILRGNPFGSDICLTIDESMRADGYTLSITTETITLTAGSDEALLNGVQTFGQWVQRNGCILPCIEVEDWPDLPARGYYQDCSRGRVPTLENLKETADLLCRYKINEWQLYVEHTYLFRRLSEAWRDDTPLSGEDIMELDAYCRQRHIELVPSLASFGHMYRILSTKSASNLCELEGSTQKPFSFVDVMQHHTVNVSHPCAMEFIKKLIAEFMPLFSSNKFNICCDETFDLCKGRSAQYAQEHGGVQEVYVQFVSELCQWLIDQGKTPQFWGDIISRSPETYDRIPKGTVCLSWGYSPTQKDSEVKKLADIGAVQYACPGVGTWNQWIPLFESSYNNIRLMCKYAHQYKCVGLLNTDWGDYGHICAPELSVPGILYGAAFSWNSAEVSFEEMNQAISFLHFGQCQGDLMSVVAKLSDKSLFDWFHAVKYMEETDPEKRSALFADVLPNIGRADEVTNEMVDIINELNSKACQMQEDKRYILHIVGVLAGAIKLFNDVGLYIAANFEGLSGVEYRNGHTLACDLEWWFHQYKKVWRRTSREGGLHNLQNMINAYADMLRNKE